MNPLELVKIDPSKYRAWLDNRKREAAQIEKAARARGLGRAYYTTLYLLEDAGLVTLLKTQYNTEEDIPWAPQWTLAVMRERPHHMGAGEEAAFSRLMARAAYDEFLRELLMDKESAKALVALELARG